MMRSITGTPISAVLALSAGSFLVPSASAQEIEIISGFDAPAARVGAGPGIRVLAFVRFEPESTTYRVVEPVLATEVLSVQEALANAGYDSGARDGILGPATAAALTAFQSARELEECGCVNYATAMALGLQRRVVQTVVGSPEDEASAEILMPEGRLAPRREATPAPPLDTTPPDTVAIVRGRTPDWWGYAGVPVLGIPLPPGSISPIAPAAAPRGGVPFGGSATRGRSTIRAVPPPPRR